MDGAERNDAPRAGFFQVTLGELKRIAACGGSHKEMAAYLVLCSGVSGRHPLRYCTHGAKSASDRAGISYRTAEHAMDWLHDHGFIRKPSEGELQHLGKRQSRALTVRWIVVDDQPDVGICRQFTDRAREGATSALRRLVTELGGTDEITRGRAVMDAILLFIALMKEQDFGEWAGVLPAVWHQQCVPVSSDDDDAEHIVPVEGTDQVLLTVKCDNAATVDMAFARQALGDSDADDSVLVTRFRHAMKGLRQLRLVYRVLVIWAGDPLNATTSRSAEPLATLYVSEKWAQSCDPYVQPNVNRAAWYTGAAPGESDFNSDGTPAYAYSGRYRYIVKRGQETRTNVIGQLRVRYWPSSPLVMEGRSIERSRTERWQEAADRLGRS